MKTRIALTLLLMNAALTASAGFVLASTAPSQQPAKRIEAMIRGDLLRKKSNSFEHLLSQWEDQYGSQAVAPLLRIASDSTFRDAHRYIALMGAAKLGGKESAQLVIPFLKDSSWMMRSAALRALHALGNPSSGTAVLPLLKDPALVVRSEAVDTIARLRPEGAIEALMATIESSANYHAGRAQWVPQKALAALVSLDAKSVAPRLKPLLRHVQDPDLQRQAVRTLESLTGKKLKPEAPLSAQIKAWEKTL